MIGLNYFILLGFFLSIAFMVYTLVNKEAEKE